MSFVIFFDPIERYFRVAFRNSGFHDCSRGPGAWTKRGKKRSAGAAELGERPPDQYAKLFGRVEPRNIPESSAWWHARQAELLSITEDHELGIMTGMITMTQNDLCPELLAHARRGPCAAPTAAEMCESLLTRRATGSKRPDIQKDATASVLSYQRRSRGLKRQVLRRHCVTPLGISADHWDKTGTDKASIACPHSLVGQTP